MSWGLSKCQKQLNQPYLKAVTYDHEQLDQRMRDLERCNQRMVSAVWGGVGLEPFIEQVTQKRDLLLHAVCLNQWSRVVQQALMDVVRIKRFSIALVDKPIQVGLRTEKARIAALREKRRAEAEQRRADWNLFKSLVKRTAESACCDGKLGYSCWLIEKCVKWEKGGLAKYPDLNARKEVYNNKTSNIFSFFRQHCKTDLGGPTVVVDYSISHTRHGWFGVSRKDRQAIRIKEVKVLGRSRVFTHEYFQCFLSLLFGASLQKHREEGSEVWFLLSLEWVLNTDCSEERLHWVKHRLDSDDVSLGPPPWLSQPEGVKKTSVSFS